MSSNSGSGRIGLLGATFIALLVVKLIHPTALSWFWVFFPLLFWFFLAVGLAVLAGTAVGTVGFLGWVSDKLTRKTDRQRKAAAAMCAQKKATKKR